MSGYTTPGSEKSLFYFKQVAADERLQRQDLRRREKRRCQIIFWLCLSFTLLVIVGLSVGLGIGISQKQSHGVDLSYTGQNDSYIAMLNDGLYQSSFSSSGQDDFQFTQEDYELTMETPSSTRLLVHVNRSEIHQEIGGIGAAMTDSSADLLLQLKNSSIDEYNQVMDYLFNQRTGYTLLRVPIGASDFAPPGFNYTLADTEGPQSDLLADFNIAKPSVYILPVLKDALARNPHLKLVVCPWSAPAWMKTTNTTGNGGSLIDSMQPVFVEYLVKSVQAFNAALNTSIWALSPQNEPTNATPYPSMIVDVNTLAKILEALRGRLAQVGLGNVLLLGIEDNWSAVPMANQLYSINASAIDGLAFHCYYGNYTMLAELTAPGKSVHMTECTSIETGPYGQSSDVAYWMRNIFAPMSEFNVASVLAWNLALDNSDYGPRLATALCQNCIGVLDIDGDKVTPAVQATMLSHYATAAADLTRFNGTGPYRVDAVLNEQASKQTGCLTDILALGAKWDKARDDSLQRLGLVLYNACDNTVGTTVQLEDGSNVDIDINPGLATVVFASIPGPNITST